MAAIRKAIKVFPYAQVTALGTGALLALAVAGGMPF